ILPTHTALGRRRVRSDTGQSTQGHAVQCELPILIRADVKHDRPSLQPGTRGPPAHRIEELGAAPRERYYPEMSKQKRKNPFSGFDLQSFWRPSDFADKKYVDNPLTKEKVALVEDLLGNRLPAGYVALMATQNGGFPQRTNHRVKQPTSWAQDHIAIKGIFSIGQTR